MEGADYDYRKLLVTITVSWLILSDSDVHLLSDPVDTGWTKSIDWI